MLPIRKLHFCHHRFVKNKSNFLLIMGYDFESSATIVVLLVLISIYLYILISPGQPHVPEHTRNFVIPADTLENFQAVVKGKNDWKFTDDIGSSGLPGNYTPPKQNWGNGQDDFFLFEEGSLGKCHHVAYITTFYIVSNLFTIIYFRSNRTEFATRH